MRRPSLSRRELFALGLGAFALPALLRAQSQSQTPAPGSAAAAPDQLYDPSILERRDAIVSESANDATVKAAELKLSCPCPCTLDVFTCRTTDFTCSYSPERHREVVALVEGQHMNVDQVLAAMVDKYGEEALMAPIEKGFNIVGYVFPAAVILGLAAVITAVLALKQRNLPVEALAGAPAAPGAMTPDEVARVEAELRELES